MDADHCACTRLVFLGCNHTQLLKSTTCRLEVHKPHPGNVLTWQHETCTEAHQQIDFVTPICEALNDQASASEIEYAYSFNTFCATPKPRTVRFQLPHSCGEQWQTDASPDDEVGHNEDKYEEITRRYNATSRKIRKIARDHRKKVWAIALDIYCAEKAVMDGDNLSRSCSPRRRLASLYDERRRVANEEHERMGVLTDILRAQLQRLQSQRELAAYGVLSECAARSAKQRIRWEDEMMSIREALAV